MVHALHKIHGMLKPGGMLIDMRPLPELPKVDVRIETQEHLVGWLRETGGREQYVQAEDAISKTVEDGLYLNSRTEQFTYHVYADAVSELVCYLEETWTDAITDDIMFQRASELMRSAVSDKEVGLHEVVRITRLIPVHTDIGDG